MFKKIDYYRLAFIATEFRQNGEPEEPFNLSILATMICTPLVSLMTPMYIYFHIKHKKANRYPNGQKTLDQIASIVFVPSVSCIMLMVHIITEYLMNIFVDMNPKSPIPRLLVEILVVAASALGYIYGAGLLFFYNILFSNLLNVFIVLLSIQRFVVVCLKPKYHFLVGQKLLDLYIFLIWFGTIIYKCFILSYLLTCLYNTNNNSMSSFAGIDMAKLYGIMNILNFGSILFCAFIYCVLFWNLYKIPRLDTFFHPEFVFLYESIPLVITRTFSFYHMANYDSFDNKAQFHIHYMNHEMRYVIISTALVQFTYIFSLQSVCSCYIFLKKKQYLKLFRSNSQVEASQMAAIATFS